MEYLPEKVWERIDNIIKVKFDGIDAKFARFIELSPQTISNAKSRKTIPISLLVAINKHLKLSSDFILFGDTSPYSTPRELLED